MFRFSLSNLMLMMLPLAVVCWSIQHAIRHEPDAWTVAFVVCGLWCAIGTLVNGRKGLVLGLISLILCLLLLALGMSWSSN